MGKFIQTSAAKCMKLGLVGAVKRGNQSNFDYQLIKCFYQMELQADIKRIYLREITNKLQTHLPTENAYLQLNIRCCMKQCQR